MLKSLVNVVVTGSFSPVSINVQNALAIEKTQPRKFQEDFRGGYIVCIMQTVNKMSVTEKEIALGPKVLYDTVETVSRLS